MKSEIKIVPIITVIVTIFLSSPFVSINQKIIIMFFLLLLHLGFKLIVFYKDFISFWGGGGLGVMGA